MKVPRHTLLLLFVAMLALALASCGVTIGGRRYPGEETGTTAEEATEPEFSVFSGVVYDDARLLSARDFTVTGSTLTATVPNAREVYSFADGITVSRGASWQISTDLEGTNVAATKTVSLREGDNTFYLLITAENGRNVSVYAVTIRRRPLYTVRFDTNGGTSVAPLRVEEGKTASAPTAEPTRSGYSFAGWNSDFSEPVTDNITVAAIWTPQSYTVAYDLNGGTGVGSNPETYTIEDDVALAGATRENCTFLGWYTQSGIQVTNLKGNYGALTLKAKWEYPITVNEDGVITGVSTLFKQNFTSYVIPSSQEGVTIRAIGKQAFSYCTSLKSITIPDSVTSIGDAAFDNCTSLSSVTVPIGVSSIGWAPFFRCSGLNSITVAAGNPKYHSSGNCLIETASKTLIQGCSKSVIPNDGSVTVIGDNAFYECAALSSVTIPVGTVRIGTAAFEGCTALKTVVIPATVTAIERDAFGYSGLTSVTFVNTVGWYRTDKKGASSGTDISVQNTYDNALYLKHSSYEYWYRHEETTPIIVNDSGVVTGVSYTFRTTVTDYVIPTSLDGKTIVSIAANAFAGCTKLKSITVPSGVTSIGKGAFSGCSALTSITIPFVGAKAGVTSSGTEQFPFGYIFGEESYSGGNATTQYFYYNRNSSICYTYYIPASLRSVTVTGGNVLFGAFYACTGLTTISIPQVSRIEEYAFYNCSGLSSFTVPSSVTEIGTSAFDGCASLSSINVPASVICIEKDAFRACSSLSSATFEKKTGWFVNVRKGATEGTNMTVDESSLQNAVNLRHAYSQCYWYSTGEAHTHNYVYVVDTEATCLGTGMKHLECTGCGQTKPDSETEIPADPNAHFVIDWTVDAEATLLSNGHRRGVCEFCGAPVEEEIVYTPNVWTANNERHDWKIRKNVLESLGGEHYYPTEEHSEGLDFYFEVDFLWNETIEEQWKDGDGMRLLLVNDATDKRDNFFLLVPKNNVWTSSDAKASGGFDYGWVAKHTIVCGPMGVNGTGTNAENFPNIGEYGWHRIGVKVHLDAAIIGDGVTYTMLSTLYLDGEKVWQIRFVEDGDKTFSDWIEKGLMLFTAENAGGELEYDDPSGSLYFEFNAYHTAEMADLVLVRGEPKLTAVAPDYEPDVVPVADPADAIFEIADGVEIPAPIWFRAKSE